jgi:hypothetical protein
VSAPLADGRCDFLAVASTVGADVAANPVAPASVAPTIAAAAALTSAAPPVNAAPVMVVDAAQVDLPYPLPE